MYDDYDLDYAPTYDHSQNLDDYASDAYDLDEDYARDEQDYTQLSYYHYA